MASGSELAGRNRLARLLAVACRVEHALTCQYLFTAFSMKRTHAEAGVTYRQLERMRQWEGDLLLIARQEMEHLGLAFNLRSAIGEAPGFEASPFPFDETVEGIHLHHALERFSEATMTGFAEMEMPDDLPRDSAYRRFLKDRASGVDPDRVDAIARLYAEIRELVASLPEDLLFIGPPGAQFNTHDIFPGAIRGLNLADKPAYQVLLTPVTNRTTALAVIDQITTEGEGAGDAGGAGSHFARVMDILIDLVALRDADPGFEPARAVLDNPALEAAPGAAVVTDPFARDAMALFESCYETMLLALSRFFAFPPDDRDEMRALQQVAFFPMMTTVIRPLGELLTELPSGADGPARAGASFAARGAVEAPPHKTATFRMLDLRHEQMADEALALVGRVGEIRGVDEATRQVLRDRLQFVYEQICRSRINLVADYQGKPDGF